MHYTRPKYNYYLRVWTLNGIIQDCNHLVIEDCQCRARRWQGKTLQQVEEALQLHLMEA